MTHLDRDLATVLANWANERRGWDIAGSLAALARVKGRNADDVAMAWIRFCADRNVTTPGAFPASNGPHWIERVSPPAEGYAPPRTNQACRLCGRHDHQCICPEGPTHRPPVARPPTDEYRQARQTRN